MANKIQIRRDTTANWAINDTILSQGELGLDINLRKLKIGDGTSHWSALDFFIGDTGPQGLPGADGAIGPQGEVGPAGATNELINGSHTVSLNSSGVVTFPAASNTQLYIEGSEIFGIDTSAVAISSNSVVVINTYDPTLHSWEFGNNGTLTIPGDINTNGSQITGWSGYLDLNIDGSISLSTITGSGVNLILGANGYEFVFGSTGNLTLPANSSIESNTSSVIKVGANLSQLETIYTDSLIQLTDAFTTNSDLPGYPWGITLPLSVPLTYDELILLSPETFPNQYAVVPIAHATNLAYSEWRDAAAATEIRVNVSNKSWTFDSDGGIAFPLSSVDLHNGGVQNAQVLKFNTANQQVVITGPTPAAGNSAERIIIQGQRATGNGEGGDVYLWGGDSDVNGGDIKIYAGDGQASPSNGGYVNIDGGSGYAYGGNVEITGGYASQFGGNVVLSAGNAGGQNGVPGQVNINSNGNQWVFGNDGRLTLPGPVYNNNYPNTISSNYGFVFTPTFNGEGAAPALYLSYNDGMLLQPITNDYRVNSNQASPFYIEGADVDGSVIPGDVFISGGRNYNTSVSGGIHIGTNKTSAVQIGASGVLTTITFADSSVQSTAYQKVAVPTHSTGIAGDTAGMVAFDSTYFYYCTANYVSHTIASLTVNNIRGPAQNANYSNNGGGTGTMVGFDGPIAGLASGQVFTHNAVQYTIQDVSNTSNPYAYIIFTPQMDGPTTASITAGTVFDIGDGTPQADIWKRTAHGTGTW